MRFPVLLVLLCATLIESLDEALLKQEWTQGVLNNSQSKDLHVPHHGSLFPAPIATQVPAKVPDFLTRLRRASSSLGTSSCLAPPQPVNGEYKLDRYFCDDTTADCQISEGTALEPSSQLVYRCNPGYRATRNPEVTCRAGGKWTAIPDCIEVTCDSLNSVSTMVSCTRFGKWVNCDSLVPPETRAEVGCRPGYKKDTNIITTRRGVVTCNVDGEWQPQPIRCEPVCGLVTTNLQPFVSGGTAASVAEFPWHASLFVEKKTQTGNEKVFTCGGTIIHTNLVLTAAHCVYDERIKRTMDPGKLFVITGNIFRDYDSPVHSPEFVRKATVKNVYISCEYYGIAGNYASDIALLELERQFEYSGILLPACLDDSEHNAQFLEAGVLGKVAGFGRTTTGKNSGILQTITVPYVSYSRCKASKHNPLNDVLIGADKFCAGYENGSAVCEGDSGGGLVFRKGDLWYVMGIVSVGLGVDFDTGERTCDRYAYSLYTKVSIHMLWIQNVLSYTERSESYPPCRSHSQVPMATPAQYVTTSHTTVSHCLAPPEPANGERKLHSNFCKGDMDCNISEGTELEVNSQLVYRCAPTFIAEGSTDVYCMAGGKWSSIPTCIKVASREPSASTYTTSLPERLMGNGRAGAISRQKCAEYSKYVYQIKYTSLPGNSQKEVNVSQCAVRSFGLDSFEIGINRAMWKEFPYMAAIGENSKDGGIRWYCGGTLISETFVLTAVQCTNSPATGANATWVRVGDLSLVEVDSSTAVDRRIVEIIIHPEYKPPSYYHDIALLRLETRVPFNGWIRPACLNAEPSIGTKVIATGWGGTNLAEIEDYSKWLKKIILSLVDTQTCNVRWAFKVDPHLPNGVVEDLLICAGDYDAFTCPGDVGGPMVIYSNTSYCMYEVVGIISYGNNCGGVVPRLHTRVSAYIPWIESVVWNQG